MEKLRIPVSFITLAGFVAIAGTGSAFLQPSCNLRPTRISGQARFNTGATRRHDTHDTRMTVRMLYCESSMYIHVFVAWLHAQTFAVRCVGVVCV